MTFGDAPELHLAGLHGQHRLQPAVDRERCTAAEPAANRLGETPSWFTTSTGCDRAQGCGPVQPAHQNVLSMSSSAAHR